MITQVMIQRITITIKIPRVIQNKIQPRPEESLSEAPRTEPGNRIKPISIENKIGATYEHKNTNNFTVNETNNKTVNVKGKILTFTEPCSLNVVIQQPKGIDTIIVGFNGKDVYQIPKNDIELRVLSGTKNYMSTLQKQKKGPS